MFKEGFSKALGKDMFEVSHSIIRIHVGYLHFVRYSINCSYKRLFNVV